LRNDNQTFLNDGPRYNDKYDPHPGKRHVQCHNVCGTDRNKYFVHGSARIWTDGH